MLPRFQAARPGLRGLVLTVLVALMAGCGGSSEDAFNVHYDNPSWSPDGKSIAFVASDDLYVTKLGGRTTRHTDVGKDEFVSEPVWSPDGKKIAYDVWEGNSFSFAFRTVVRDVGSGRILMVRRDLHPFGSCHVWSPDGKRIIFLAEHRGDVDRADLTIVNSDGSGRERLASVGSGGECPAWSPDGRSIAYICCGIRSDVRVVDSNGKRKRRLTRGMYAGEVSWSPDGGQIAFQHIGDGDPPPEGYVSVRPDGSGKLSLAPGAGATGLVWSPDSRRIAYYIEEGEGNNPLYVSARDGRNRRLVTHVNCCASWSPDGTRLAVAKDDPDGEAAIYVIDADGKRLVKISSPPARDE